MSETPPLSSLPADIQAYLTAEIAKAVAAANQPPAPRQLTPEELVLAAVDRARREMSGEHVSILDALDTIVRYILPKSGQQGSV